MQTASRSCASTHHGIVVLEYEKKWWSCAWKMNFDRSDANYHLATQDIGDVGFWGQVLALLQEYPDKIQVICHSLIGLISASIKNITKVQSENLMWNYFCK